MKPVTALLLKQFWNDDAVWGESRYADELQLKVNGELADPELAIHDLEDTDMVSIYCGVMTDPSGGARDLDKVFASWLKKRPRTDIERFVVEVSAEGAEALKMQIIAAGAKVLS